MTDPKNGAERLASPLEADAERLAALLDGRLDERRRAEAVARLASSDDEFEAFVDALAVTRELEAEDAAEGVTPLRPRVRQRWWRRPGGQWAAIAAVLAGLALLPAVWSRGRDPGVDDPQSYAALLESKGAGLPAGWDPTPWRTTRGAGDPLTPQARAVRLGVHMTDLEAAIAARGPQVAEARHRHPDAPGRGAGRGPGIDAVPADPRPSRGFGGKSAERAGDRARRNRRARGCGGSPPSSISAPGQRPLASRSPVATPASSGPARAVPPWTVPRRSLPCVSPPGAQSNGSVRRPRETERRTGTGWSGTSRSC